MTKLVSPSFPSGLEGLRSETQARLGILPKTEYVPSHYKIQTEQSRVMKELEWEKEPVTKGALFSAVVEFNIGFWGFFGPFLYVVFR